MYSSTYNSMCFYQNSSSYTMIFRHPTLIIHVITYYFNLLSFLFIYKSFFVQQLLIFLCPDALYVLWTKTDQLYSSTRNLEDQNFYLRCIFLNVLLSLQLQGPTYPSPYTNPKKEDCYFCWIRYMQEFLSTFSAAVPYCSGPSAELNHKLMVSPNHIPWTHLLRLIRDEGTGFLLTELVLTYNNVGKNNE